MISFLLLSTTNGLEEHSPRGTDPILQLLMEAPRVLKYQLSFTMEITHKEQYACFASITLSFNGANADSFFHCWNMTLYLFFFFLLFCPRLSIEYVLRGRVV